MNKTVSFLNFMNAYGSKAVESVSKSSNLFKHEVSKDSINQYNENRTKLYGMMLGYVANSKEYHDIYLYNEYLNKLSNLSTTPKDFKDFVSVIPKEDFIVELEKKAIKQNNSNNWYNNLLFAVEMGNVGNTRVNDLDSMQKFNTQTAVYDIAYQYDEAFNKTSKQLKKIK